MPWKAGLPIYDAGSRPRPTIRAYLGIKFLDRQRSAASGVVAPWWLTKMAPMPVPDKRCTDSSPIGQAPGVLFETKGVGTPILSDQFPQHGK